MRLAKGGVEIFVPDGCATEEALGRTTHMGIVGHPDDLEILAWPAIHACFGRDDRWFCGVVVADGAGAVRSGPYAAFTDEQIRDVRRREQKKAAVVGEYGAAVLLDHTSDEVKAVPRRLLVEELATLLRAARPSVVYTHNLADRHDTHLATALAALEACRALSEQERPRRLLGGEVWGDLDWLPEPAKVAEDAAGHENIAAALIGVFDSQVEGGKRHDLAVQGRRRAHATYRASHAVDETTALTFAMDLTPLLADPGQDPADYLQSLVDRFAAELRDGIARVQGGRPERGR